MAARCWGRNLSAVLVLAAVVAPAAGEAWGGGWVWLLSRCRGAALCQVATGPAWGTRRLIVEQQLVGEAVPSGVVVSQTGGPGHSFATFLPPVGGRAIALACTRAEPLDGTRVYGLYPYQEGPLPTADGLLAGLRLSLLRSLAGADAACQEEAAAALGGLPPDGVSLEALVAAASSPSARLRGQATRALLNLGDQATARRIDGLLASLPEAHVQNDDAIAASDVVGWVSTMQQRQQVPALGHLLASRRADMRAAACRALGCCRVPESLPLLVPLLDDVDEGVRRSAAWGMAEATGSTAQPGSTIVGDQLARIVAHWKRWWAEKAKPRFDLPEPVGPALALVAPMVPVAEPLAPDTAWLRAPPPTWANDGAKPASVEQVLHVLATHGARLVAAPVDELATAVDAGAQTTALQDLLARVTLCTTLQTGSDGAGVWVEARATQHPLVKEHRGANGSVGDLDQLLRALALMHDVSPEVREALRVTHTVALDRLDAAQRAALKELVAQSPPTPYGALIEERGTQLVAGLALDIRVRTPKSPNYHRWLMGGMVAQGEEPSRVMAARHEYADQRPVLSPWAWWPATPAPWPSPLTAPERGIPRFVKSDATVELAPSATGRYRLGELTQALAAATGAQLKVAPAISDKEVWLRAVDNRAPAATLARAIAGCLGSEWRDIGDLWYLGEHAFGTRPGVERLYQYENGLAKEAQRQIGRFVAPLWRRGLLLPPAGAEQVVVDTPWASLPIEWRDLLRRALRPADSALVVFVPESWDPRAWDGAHVRMQLQLVVGIGVPDETRPRFRGFNWGALPQPTMASDGRLDQQAVGG